MTSQDQQTSLLDWGSEDEVDERDALIVDVEGFEGPLDLLLALARTQKVDLKKISVLALARQYLEFVEAAQALRLEIAADYLVMAAWLTFLKSKLLLPLEDNGEHEPTGEELAAMLAFRLQRLGAMREAAGQLMARQRLGLDVFARGQPEPVRITRQSQYNASMYDLLRAYADRCRRQTVTTVRIEKRLVWSIKEARQRLESLLGIELEWGQLELFIADFLNPPQDMRTVIASTFGATLEMAREGRVELRQKEAFAPIYIRRCEHDGELGTVIDPSASKAADASHLKEVISHGRD